MADGKVLVIGWDGATFDMIGPLAAEGRLPHVASLMRNGSWGRLESTTPPLTPVAWTSLATGVNPGKHGVYDAMVFNPRENRMSFINASHRKVQPIWSMLSAHGRKVGVMNVPVTYPPDPVNGSFISGMFTPEEARDFAQPPDLLGDIEKRFGPYRIECRHDENPARYLELIIDIEIDYRERVASYLMRRDPWDFWFVVFMASDRVQHFYWKYLDKRHPDHRLYGNAIASVYERMDQALGRLLEAAGPETSVLMVSDHGSGPLTDAFFLNNWLRKKGYLHLNGDFFPRGKRRPRRALPKMVTAIKEAIPIAIRKRLRSKMEEARKNELNFFYERIDWEKTVAFSEGVAGGIFINPKTVPSEAYDGTADRIRDELLALRDPAGRPVVKAVHRRDRIYQGDFVDLAPDLTVICDSGFQIISPNEFFYFQKEMEDALFLDHRWSGRHEQDGIFIVKGPHVRKGVELAGCRIIDVTPTALYLMGESVPGHVDGRVVDQAIDPAFFAAHPVEHAEAESLPAAPGTQLTEQEEKEISERLKSLGYME